MIASAKQEINIGDLIVHEGGNKTILLYVVQIDDSKNIVYSKQISPRFDTFGHFQHQLQKMLSEGHWKHYPCEKQK